MSGKKQPRKSKNKGGRPTDRTEATVMNLEEAFRNGFSVRKACELASISYNAYYQWLKIDKPFNDRMERAQQFVAERARQNISMAIIDGDVTTSKWYAERKIKEEFALRVESTGAEGERLYREEDDTLRQLNENMKKLLHAGSKRGSETDSP